MSIPAFDEIIEPNDQTEARRAHLERLRELVGNPYPNKFERSKLSGEVDTITNILKHEPVAEIEREMKQVLSSLAEGERPPSEIKDALNEKLKALGNIRITGRMAVPPRIMGKAAFVHLSDGISRLQIYVRKQDAVAISNDTGEAIEQEGHAWEVFGNLDHGDFIGVEGFLFITNTGELSVHVEKLQFLAKAMLPMPDKMHGIADPEIRQRQRYADLIASSLQIEHEGLTTREVFEVRAKMISSIRNYLEDHGYIEVETPMLTPKATGAAAKPFKTHHNALDIELYARIAPELYLKRLVVGGFEKVYELNRNFRNEGISYKHNPEFTMLEFYCAYMDVSGMMDFAEQLLRQSVEKATGGLKIRVQQTRGKFPIYIDGYQGSRSAPVPDDTPMTRTYLNVFEHEIDFSKFQRISMLDAILEGIPFARSLMTDDPKRWLRQGANSIALNRFLWWVENDLSNEVTFIGDSVDDVHELPQDEIDRIIDNKWNSILSDVEDQTLDDKEYGLALLELFEDFIEERLIQPTFIVDYPKAISPLSKASPENPQIAERFELFINGMEVANGFSELNDPQEQYERFVDQMSARERGDEEAMVLDEDYIRALSYGMPPAAGIGIGIDRLTMLLTNKHSIRDVILFPHMRPEKKKQEEEAEEGA